MIVLGLLLVVVAVGAGVFAVIAPTSTSRVVELTALGVTVSASPLAMFVAGAVSVVLLGLGFALISRGTRRKAASRKELRQLRKQQADAAASTPPSGASTSAVAGERTSRREQPHRDSDKDTSTGDTSPRSSTDTSTDTDTDSSH